MDKKSVIVVVLISVLWVGYLYISKMGSIDKKPVEKKTETIQKQEADTSSKNTTSIKIDAAKTQGAEKHISIKTKKFAVTLSNRGAAVTGCKYIERNIDLIAGSNPYGSKGDLNFALHFDDDDFQNGNSLDEALWQYREEGSRVVFYTDIQMNGAPVRVEKSYLFKDDGYGFNVEYRLKNNGGKDIAFKNGAVLFSPGAVLGPSLDYSNTYNRLMSIYSIDGSFKKADKGGDGFMFGCGGSSDGEPLKKLPGKINWAGIMSRYFLLIMVPEGNTGSSVLYDNRKTGGFRTAISMNMGVLGAGKEIKKSFKVYLGEKDKKLLASVDASIVDAADINRLIEPIRNFVVWCLLNLNKLFGNLGWALVVFSLLTKVVFMPLTMKSTESMKKMQQLSPKLNELKAKYKDKPDVMNKEMMKLYKENKVNPMGGCFPLLLQMPFFFALYSALIDSIDMWHAPFIFWMKDLSMPDTVAVISGLSGFHLNILPILMTASTFVQQKLTTVDTGGQQKIMMMMMPLVFIFIFWSMPSGLVLYWALQNVFQIIQQLFINYRGKKEKSS